MSFETIKNLVSNVSLFLVLGLVATNLSTGSFFVRSKTKALTGLLSGVVGLLAAVNPVSLAPGLSMDASFILAGSTAMFFGIEPALISLFFIVTGKLLIGSGALAGIVAADVCVAAGLIWNKYRLRDCMTGEKKPWAELVSMGAFYAACQLLLVSVIPSAGVTGIPEISIEVSLSAIAAGTLGFLFIGITAFTRLQTMKTKRILTDALAESVEDNQRLSEQLEKRDSLLRSLFDSISDLAFYKDNRSVYLDCNAAFEDFARRNRQDIVGQTDYELFDHSTAAQHVGADREVLMLGQPKLSEETTINQDGEDVVLETLRTPCCDKDGGIIGLIGISRDITERKKKEEDILFLTYHDVSTGLYNSNYLDLVRSAYSQSPPLPLSVIMCDLNGLKLINDAFGHTEGNKLLREAAHILQRCARPTDIIARIGGDEFVMLLPNADFGEVQSVVEHIEAACREFRKSSDCPYSVNLAMGYATSTRLDETVDQIIKTAEDFMNKKKLLDLTSVHNSILSSIKTTMYEKSLETEEHAERLAELSQVLGRQLGLQAQELVELKLFAMLHDIGKIGVDERILTKKEKLTEDDWLEIRKHPEIGYRITHATADLKDISDYILYHHERWDGRGYPLGLSGNEIPLLARVLSVVDSYDAMTNDRVYRKALSETDAVAEIVRNSGSQFDPNITEIFVQVILHASAFAKVT